MIKVELNKMTLKATRSIQSHSDRTYKNQNFKARVKRAAENNLRFL